MLGRMVVKFVIPEQLWHGVVEDMVVVQPLSCIQSVCPALVDFKVCGLWDPKLKATTTESKFKPLGFSSLVLIWPLLKMVSQ